MKSNACPYCDATMSVRQMHCECCGVSIDAEFAVDRLSRLPIEHQRFIEMFVLASGSLKEIAKKTGVSYPTVRSRLDKVISELRNQIVGDKAVAPSVLNVFDDSSDGQTEGDAQSSADQAKRLIKRI